QVELLEAVHLGQGLYRAGAHAAKASGGLDVEQKGEIGAHPPGADVGDFANLGGMHATSVPLVGQGGVKEAIADDDVPLAQLGTDHLLHQLRAGGCKQKDFGQRPHILVLRVGQDASDDFSHSSTARLA